MDNDDEDDLSSLNDPLTLILFGSFDWPRWMIYHRQRQQWWGHGTWWHNQRDGELWHDFEKAVDEFRQVEQQHFDSEDN